MSAVPAIQDPAIRVTRPQSRTAETKPVPRKRRRSRALPLVAVAVNFTLIAGVAFMASSLGGHVMVEKARREGIRASERWRDAKRAEAVLRQRVDQLSSLSSVESWALTNGFLPPHGLSAPSTSSGLVVMLNE